MPRLDTQDKLFMCVRCVQTPHGSSWTLPLRVILVPPSSPMLLPQSAQSVCKPGWWCCSCYCCSAVLSLSLSVSFCSPTPYESKTRSTLAFLGLMHADIFTDRPVVVQGYLKVVVQGCAGSDCLEASLRGQIYSAFRSTTQACRHVAALFWGSQHQVYCSTDHPLLLCKT